MLNCLEKIYCSKLKQEKLRDGSQPYIIPISGDSMRTPDMPMVHIHT